MKRFIAVSFAVLFMFAFSSCARPAVQQSNSAASPAPSFDVVSAPEPSVALPNPIVEVEGPEDFSSLGFVITPYQEADSVIYSIIGGKIAQIEFTTDGDAYTYRAAETAEDILGVYESFDPLPQTLDLEGPGFKVSVLIRTIGGGDGGGLAEWEFEGVRYSLYTPDRTGYEALTDVLLPIIYVDLPFATCCG